MAILPMPTTQFLYIDGKLDTNKELVVNNTVRITAEYYMLPKHIIFEMRRLGHSIFGETVVDIRQKNRIKLNIDLGLKETVFVLTHEIIHLSQITTGQLTINKDGSVVWDYGYKVDKNRLSNLSYEEYMKLPWEADVVKKQQFLLEKLHKK